MFVEELTFNDRGLIPAIVVDYQTNEVLMLAYMNEEAIRETVKSGLATFYSRSRQQLWVKGQTSGNSLDVKWLRTDCDSDTLLVGCDPRGPACHEGYHSCFYKELEDGEWKVIAEREMTPEEMYGDQ